MGRLVSLVNRNLPIQYELVFKEHGFNNMYYLRTESIKTTRPRAGVHDPGLNWVVGVEYMDRAQGHTM